MKNVLVTVVTSHRYWGYSRRQDPERDHMVAITGLQCPIGSELYLRIAAGDQQIEDIRSSIYRTIEKLM